MENGPFVDDFPIKTSIYEGFSMAMLNNQMVFCFFLGIWGFFLFDEAIFFYLERYQGWVQMDKHVFNIFFN